MCNNKCKYKEILSELCKVQEKLHTIDKLTNCMQTLNAKQNKEVAYLIHQIAGSPYFDSEHARQVFKWQIESKKDLFISI